MLNRAKFLTVPCIVITIACPASGQSDAFLGEYILLHSFTAAMKAEKVCKGFLVDLFSVGAQFEKEKTKLDMSTVVPMFDPVHKANINSIGVDLWCADQWEELGPKGVIRKGFLVRKPD